MKRRSNCEVGHRKRIKTRAKPVGWFAGLVKSKHLQRGKTSGNQKTQSYVRMGENVKDGSRLSAA